MAEDVASYRVLSPLGLSTAGRTPIAPPLDGLAGKTICAMRHTFRADETFAMIERLLHEQYEGITFVPNSDIPDLKLSNEAEALQLTRAFVEKGCDAVLIGNAA